MPTVVDTERGSTFLPIARIDEGRREVYAVATTENHVTRAQAGNGIITFEASKRGMERMQAKAAALGAAGGIVRERWHDDGRDVGRVLVWEPDEERRQVVVGMHISSGAEDTWQKILDGTLRGVSVGGKILQSETKVVRTDAGGERIAPHITDIEYDEIILCGSPSDPGALIQKVYRTDEGVSDVVGDGDLDVARAFSASARQARAAQQHAGAKGPQPKTGANSTTTHDTSGGKFGDSHNFVGKQGDKFVTYVGGKKVGEYDNQADAEKAYNAKGGPGSKGDKAAAADKKGDSKPATANQREARNADSAPKAGAAVTTKTATMGAKVTATSPNGDKVEGTIASKPGEGGTIDVKTSSGETREYDVEQLVHRAEETHGAFTGTHSHGHAANGAQGSDDSHDHEHTHDGDGDHGHGHGDVARAELETTDRLPEERGGPKEEASVKRNEAAATQTAEGEQTEDRVERTQEERDAMINAVAVQMQLPRDTVLKLDEDEIEHVYRTQVVEPAEQAAAAVAEAEAEVKRVADEAEVARVAAEAATEATEATEAEAAAAVARTDPDPAPGEGEPGDDVHREGAESAAGEMSQAEVGMQALGFINKLIASEAAELAEGEATDACDVQSLMWIRDSLTHFIKGELLEAMEMKRTLEEQTTVLANMAVDLKAYKALTADAVQRTQATALQLEAIEAERAEVKRSGDEAHEKVDDLESRVKRIEDTPIGGPVSKAPVSLDKLFAGDEGTVRTAAESAEALAAVKRNATPELRRIIEAEEVKAAIQYSQSRPQHTPPSTRATVPSH